MNNIQSEILTLAADNKVIKTQLFHVIFSFVHFISVYSLGCLHAFRKSLPYNMYLFNIRIANHILMKNKETVCAL